MKGTKCVGWVVHRLAAFPRFFFFFLRKQTHWAFNQGERKTELKVRATVGTGLRYNVPGRKFMYDDLD